MKSRTNQNTTLKSTGFGRSRLDGASGFFGAKRGAPPITVEKANQVKHELRLLDEYGNDVTPLPLLASLKQVPGKVSTIGHSGKNDDGATFMNSSKFLHSVAGDYFANMEAQTLNSQFTTTNIGKSFGGFLESKTQQSFSSMNEDRSEDDSASMTSERSDEDPHFVSRKVELPKKKESVVTSAATKELSEAELNRFVHILMTESDTQLWLDLPTVSVAPEDSEAQKVIENNTRYTKLLEARLSDNSYVNRTTQTHNPAQKAKDVQAVLLKTTSVDCQVTGWDIYDAHQSVQPLDETGDEKYFNSNNEMVEAMSTDATRGSASVNDSSSIMASMAQMEGASMTTGEGSSLMVGNSTFNSSVGGNVMESSNVSYQENEISLSSLNKTDLLESLRIMESAVLETNYAPRLLEYRDQDIPPVNEFKEDTFESRIPSLHYLWSFRCDIVRDRSVTALSWNKQNQDILAVGYGVSRITDIYSSPGLICCWSLKNPEHPGRVYACESPVSCLDFSKFSPNLLGVGFIDGRIAVYDVRNEGNVFVDSATLASKHHDPVWQVKWVDREQSIRDERSQSEALVSISTDGRVCQWLLRKGLESTDLMTLKISKQQHRGKSDVSEKSSFISRTAGGLSFDFNPSDYNLYLIATEDGAIHKCSVSYNEQYLNTYFGHSGPIHRIKWSTFHSDIFASCSADWSVGIWHQDYENMILRFLNGKESIMDIDWSPTSPTLLSCVTLDGRILVWDLAISVLDPIITHTVLDQHLLCCSFTPHTPVLVTGDENGSVNVYKLRKVNWYDIEAYNAKIASADQKLYSEKLMQIFSPLLIREHQVRDLKEHK